ncbi:enoyl-CoA hydratase/isomerase family protein, partial [Roseateles sp.]|uniref:enoyl-CoA hydratase/isomerase family protein n=1 Tax=Roseateles sp. TaxID=1971397 RepID=UPI00286BF4CE
MNSPVLQLPVLQSAGQLLAQTNGCLGLITLNRPEALNALSLAMIRDITVLLKTWALDPAIEAVVILGAGRPGKPAAFCAGGDIRFFHRAALAEDPALGDFFTEEYALNHLIHNFAKPYIALMDGVVMGGGMGISQGAKLRVLTEGSKLAMPET